MPGPQECRKLLSLLIVRRGFAGIGTDPFALGKALGRLPFLCSTFGMRIACIGFRYALGAQIFVHPALSQTARRHRSRAGGGKGGIVNITETHEIGDQPFNVRCIFVLPATLAQFALQIVGQLLPAGGVAPDIV